MSLKEIIIYIKLLNVIAWFRVQVGINKYEAKTKKSARVCFVVFLKNCDCFFVLYCVMEIVINDW